MIPDAFEDVPFTGGMDLPLMIEVYRMSCLMPEESGTLPDMSGFKAAYFDHLARNLDDWTGGEVCPGVPDLLEALSSDGGSSWGWRPATSGKPPSSSCAGMGWTATSGRAGSAESTWRKRQVVAAAVERCQEASGLVYGAGEVFLFGDTPSDIEAGTANGIETIAVATGAYSADALAECRPSLVLPDLSDTERVLDLIFGDERR